MSGDVDHADASARVTFNSTVDRLKVNRCAIHEVFITDLVELGENKWLVGAQLPNNHAFYSDSILEPGYHDLLLLLECCRQATTYGAYDVLGNPPGTAAVVNSISISIENAETLKTKSTPSNLIIEVTPQNLVFRGERPRSATLILSVVGDDGLPVGSATIVASLVAPKTFQVLRQRQRSTPPPSTDALPVIPTGDPVDPRSVGRNSPKNVVLVDAFPTAHGVRAALGIMPRNRSLIEHEYDHYPAMCLLEASRQAGLLALGEGAASRNMLVGIDASFGRFAELDAAITVTASRINRCGSTDRTEVSVEFTQSTELGETASLGNSITTFTGLA